jgi:hypothetical protein
MSEKIEGHSGPKPEPHSGPDVNVREEKFPKVSIKDVRTITLRRDKKGALRFKGERIGAATRTWEDRRDLNENWISYGISARLFKTTGGKYVAGVEVYNQTDEHYEFRNGTVSDSLEDLAKALNGTEFQGWLDNDILGELFEDTEIGDQFVEEIE